MPSLAYSLPVKLSNIGKPSAEKACVDKARGGTAALGRPSRAQFGRLFAGSGSNPA